MPTSQSPSLEIQQVVTGVQEKFSQLLAWHAEQDSQIQSQRQAFEQQRQQQTQALAKRIKAQRARLADRIEQRRRAVAEQARKDRQALEKQQRLVHEQHAQQEQLLATLQQERQELATLTRQLREQLAGVAAQRQHVAVLQDSHEKLNAALLAHAQNVSLDTVELLHRADTLAKPQSDTNTESQSPGPRLAQDTPASGPPAKAKKLAKTQTHSKSQTTGPNGADVEKAQRRASPTGKARRRAA